MTRTIIFACNNCDWSGPESLANSVSARHARFDQGDVYTTVQCPECSALAQPVDPMAPDFLIRIPGPLVRELHQLVKVDESAYTDTDMIMPGSALIDIVLDHHITLLELHGRSRIARMEKALANLIDCPDLTVITLSPVSRRALDAAIEVLKNV